MDPLFGVSSSPKPMYCVALNAVGLACLCSSCSCSVCAIKSALCVPLEQKLVTDGTQLGLQFVLSSGGTSAPIIISLYKVF